MTVTHPLRIAILGTRGVPARYGGFETFAEELGARLSEKGHEVTVYCRSAYVPRGLRSFRGMRLVRLPAPHSKYLETVIHSIYSALHALPRSWDVVYVCNSANVPAAIILWLLGKRVVLNVDGLEWRRGKWGSAGRSYYRACARVVALLPVHVVTDAPSIQRYYAEAYGRRTDLFVYGTDLEPPADDGTLARFGLQPRRYVLYVSRLEPENNAHVVVDAYRSVRTDLPLVVVGDAPYASAYIAGLKETADPRVRFLGGVYGVGYHVLRSQAAAYVQATEVGGTHPALVEAMGYGNAIVANDVPEHRDVLADAGLYYRGAMQLADVLQRVLDDEVFAEELRSRARDRAKRHFSWAHVVDDYERWFLDIAGRR